VPFVDLFTRSVLASSLMQLDALDDARRTAREVIDGPAHVGPWLGAQYRIQALTVLAAAAIHDDDITQASGLATEALELRAARPGPLGTGLALLTGARVAQLTADPRRSARLAQEALDAFVGAELTVYVPEVLDLFTVLDLDQGDTAKAARTAGAAAALRARMTTTSLHLAARGEQLDALIAARDTDSSVAAAWQGGEGLTIEELMAWIKRGHAKRRRPTHGWSSLTPTEMAVIRLIAKGLTNADIAARLVMSRRTVTTHLTHVFTKLGVATRAELAAAAARRGL
jgi:DNA-binding CsgD family transcriptional regulator